MSAIVIIALLRWLKTGFLMIVTIAERFLQLSYENQSMKASTRLLSITLNEYFMQQNMKVFYNVALQWYTNVLVVSDWRFDSLRGSHLQSRVQCLFVDGVVCLMTGHSSQDGISCKSRLKFFSSYWSVLVSFDQKC